MFEHVLQELPIDEVVHAFEDCDSQGIACALCLVPESCVELDVRLQLIRHPERDYTIYVRYLDSVAQVEVQHLAIHNIPLLVPHCLQQVLLTWVVLASVVRVQLPLLLG